MRKTALLAASLLVALPALAAEITVPGPSVTIDVIERAEFEAGQAADAHAREVNREKIQAHDQMLAAQEAKLADAIKLLEALEAGVVVPDPDPDPITPIPPSNGIPQQLLDLAPNTGGFFGAPVRDVLADLTPPTDFDRGNSYPASLLATWCGSAFNPDALLFIWTCGGHNDGNEAPVLAYSVSELRPLVLAQSFKTPDTMPDGSPVTRQKCPAPRTWGDETSPGGVHSYGGIKYRKADNSVYLAGGFPYTCHGEISGRRTDVQKFSLDTRKWSVVRSNIAHQGGYSGGGSNSYDLQLLSDGNWLLSARHFIKIMNQQGEYAYHQGGADRLGFFNFTVKIADRTDTDKPHDHFLAYDGSLNLLRMTAFHNNEGISIGKPVAKLPNHLARQFPAAAYVPEWNTVVFWNGASTLVFVNLETNEVREASYEFPGYKGFSRLGPGKLQYVGGGILVGISCFNCGLFAFKMPDDIDAVTQPPEQPAQDLQGLIDAQPDGGTLTLPAGVWDAARITKADFTLLCEPGAKIEGEVNGQGVLLQEARNFTVRGCQIKARGDIRGIWGGHGAVGLTATNNTFEGGADGILTCTSCGGHYEIVDNIFDGNGKAPPGAGHGIYISSKGAGSTALVKDNRFLNFKEGHALKSRASRTEVRGNTFVPGDRGYSRIMDFPPGGVVIVEGNTIQHNGDLGNNDVVCWGCEAWVSPWPENSMTFRNNDVTCTGATARFLNIHKASRPDARLVFENNTISGCGVEIDDNR